MKLDSRSQAVLDYIKSFVTENHYPPTVRQIAEFAGFKSSSSGQALLDDLVETGHISKVPGRKQALRINP